MSQIGRPDSDQILNYKICISTLFLTRIFFDVIKQRFAVKLPMNSCLFAFVETVEGTKKYFHWY
jgi:hypothetical protein